MVRPIPPPYSTLSHASAHTEEEQPPPAALGKYCSLMFTPRTTTQTNLHLASVIAHPTRVLGTCSFASPNSFPQLFNHRPYNTILVLWHITKKPIYTKIPHPRYISYFQVSFDAPNKLLSQVATKSYSAINETLHIFSPLSQSNKLPVKASILTLGCCPSSMVWVGMSFPMPNRGTHLPFHGTGKVGSTGRLHADV